MKRNIEILHWEEKETTGDKSTTYSYGLIWTEKDIDSRDFMEAGHANPPSSVTLHSKTFYGTARVGTYSLYLHVLKQLTSWRAAELTACNTAALSPAITRPQARARASFADRCDR